MMIQIVRVLLCEKRGFDTYENQMSIRFKFILFYGIWFNWQCVFSLLIVINYFHWKFSSKLAINMAYKAFHLTFCSISHRISIEMNGSNSCDGNSRLLDEISPGCIRWLNTLFKVPKSQSVKKKRSIENKYKCDGSENYTKYRNLFKLRNHNKPSNFTFEFYSIF